MVLGNTTNVYNITDYIVDSVSPGSPYNTIQSALDAANTAGGGQVYIRPGFYTEDLTLYDKVKHKEQYDYT